MATDRKLRKELLAKLGVTPQRLSQRAKEVKRDHGPMSTEDATYVIAHEEGMDLTKYLPQDKIDRVRNLMPRNSAAAPAAAKKPTLPAGKQVVVKIDSAVPGVDALLSVQMAKDAARMAAVYPKYYILENSLRLVICRVLEDHYGKQWWQTRVAREIRDKVEQRRTQESKEPWHSKRGQHEIFYTDFGDLKRVIQANWRDFESIFPTQHWILQRLEELEHPRNVLAHHNPIGHSDLDRINLYFDDWMELLKSVRDEVP